MRRAVAAAGGEEEEEDHLSLVAHTQIHASSIVDVRDFAANRMVLKPISLRAVTPVQGRPTRPTQPRDNLWTGLAWVLAGVWLTSRRLVHGWHGT